MASLPPLRRRHTQTPFECPVCCDDFPAAEYDSKTYALGCGHRFCRGCWREYIGSKVKTEGESARIQCMESGCNRIVRGEAVDELVDEETAAR